MSDSDVSSLAQYPKQMKDHCSYFLSSTYSCYIHVENGNPSTMTTAEMGVVRGLILLQTLDLFTLVV